MSSPMDFKKSLTISRISPSLLLMHSQSGAKRKSRCGFRLPRAVPLSKTRATTSTDSESSCRDVKTNRRMACCSIWLACSCDFEGDRDKLRQTKDRGHAEKKKNEYCQK